MKKIIQIFKNPGFLFYFLLPLLAIVAIFYLYNVLSCTYISAEYENLRPFKPPIEVFYRGYKIGKATKIEPRDDYKKSLVRITLYPKNLILPDNIIAVFKQEKKGWMVHDFVDLTYPETPSKDIIKNGSLIAGKTSLDPQSLLQMYGEKEDLQKLQKSANQTLGDIGDAAQQFAMLFSTARDILEENRGQIKLAAKNLNITTQNLSQTSLKINSSIDSKKLNNTFNNVDLTSANLKSATQNFQSVSKNLTGPSEDLGNTMPKIDTAIGQISSVAKNLNLITTGVSNSLSKPFGGLRLIFGKTVKKPNCP